MKQHDTIYGVRIGPVVTVKIDDIQIHPLNLRRKEPSEEIWLLFSRDIKENGVHNPLLLSADRKILQGQRRYLAAKKAGMKEVPARFIEPNPENTTLMKIIYRDNGDTRRNYTDDELQEIVLANWSRQRILETLPRGISRRPGQEKPIEELLTEIAAVSRTRSKTILAELRRRLREERARKKAPDLDPKILSSALSKARELKSLLKRSDSISKKIAHITESELNPVRQKIKSIEKELRDLGGVDRFLKMLDTD